MNRQTAAVDRVLTRASAIAKRRSAATVEPVDLLAALLVEESRGAELLSRFGIGLDDSQTRTLIELPEDDEEDLQTPAPPESDEFSRVVELARREAADLGGRGSELGSEHLAIGLAAAASPVSTLFGSHGATPAELRQILAREGDSSSEPLSTDVILETTETFDRPHLFRAIDAAANRASEGLRVAEDYARFVRNDAFLTEQLKRLRHEIAAALRIVSLPERLAARDTRGDVGTTIESLSAATRRSEGALLTANLHRAEEALRSLEEFGRLLDPTLGPQFEKLRYELYTIEKALMVAANAQQRLTGRDLYVLLTRSQCVRPVEEVIHSAAGGAGIFQVREKELRDRELLDHLRNVRRWTREANALLIVNDRPDLALLCDADGVHVGQDELTAREARRIVGTDKLVGVSTHDIEQARTAVLDGADYLGVGPVFRSRTKTFETLAGLEFVRQVAAEIGLPWYAIGGITGENVAAVREAGATRIAVSSAVCGAAEPRAAAEQLRTPLLKHERK